MALEISKKNGHSTHFKLKTTKNFKLYCIVIYNGQWQKKITNWKINVLKLFIEFKIVSSLLIVELVVRSKERC